MRQHSKHTRLLAILLGLSMIAAACGDDDEGGTETEGDSEEQQEDPAVAALQEVGEADPSCEGETDGTLSLGGLLPETGDLSFMGPPMTTGAALAIEEINAAGGVNGQPVEFGNEDSGDGDPPVAGDAADRHISNGVDVILGAAASGISLNVIDTVVAACRLQFSPANTSIEFTTYDDDDLYFRTAPADIMQGQLQAELAVEDGGGTAAVLARQDSYGQGLADYITLFYEETGGGNEIAVRRNYDPEAAEFSAEVEAVLNEDPDILFMVGFEESYSILQDLFEQGFTPDQKRIYFVDGNISNTVAETITDPEALVGIRGTLPSTDNPDFQDRMVDQTPNIEDFIYGPETYDAVTVIALAAAEAGTDRPDEIARHINGITRDGEACENFADCLALIEAGDDVDYNGQSGPLDFGAPGEPQRGTYAIESYGEDNLIDEGAREFRDIELPS
jgi:ABC-type branched-subunit amino acid transport system substrate-binding protein